MRSSRCSLCSTAYDCQINLLRCGGTSEYDTRMLRELKVHNVDWISVVRPEKEDIAELHARFPEIHHLVLDELVVPTIRSHVEHYGNHLYMVLHIPHYNAEHRIASAHEIDFILLPNTLITAFYDELPEMEDAMHESEEPAMQGRYGTSAAHLLSFLLRSLYRAALAELDEMQERIEDGEELIFTSGGTELLRDVSLLKRHVLDFRRALKPQQTILSSLGRQGTELYGQNTKPFFDNMMGEYLRVWELLENHTETINGLYETNQALTTYKSNETMRVFTTLAFISFIPATVAAVYGMNIARIPFAESPHAFWIVLFLMVLSAYIVYVILHRKDLV